MEVYFKELISKEASLEKLVDDLERVVQGADDFVTAIGAAADPHHEVTRRVHRLKERCLRINSEILSKARATDKLVRARPYVFVGAAVLAGLFVGLRIAGAK
jgi:ElaB/YqjD/DUF883 family membrane-anchored ribosome-binding protein